MMIKESEKQYLNGRAMEISLFYDNQMETSVWRTGHSGILYSDTSNVITERTEWVNSRCLNMTSQLVY